MIVGFFTSLLPQTPSTAISVAFVLPFMVGALVVPVLASYFSGVVNWHKNVVKELKKGTRVELSGQLRDATYKTKEGTMRSAVEIVAAAITPFEQPAEARAEHGSLEEQRSRQGGLTATSVGFRG